jgi:uncharacterized RDD family membrane protein YckC
LLLDTTHNIATPEGVELRLPVAGIGSRAMAWLIDAALKVVVVMVAAIALSVAGGTGGGLMLIGLFVVLWLYNVLFEVFGNGATPGKRTLGLRVMNANGTPVGWTGSLIRNLLRFVDSLPGCYAFGCVSVMLSENFQRLGDLAAGTIVVYAEKKAPRSRFGEVAPAPLMQPLSLDEQQAIVSFGDRAPRLNAERAEELAALLLPIISDIDAPRLRGHAAWLAGGGHKS